MSVILCDSGPIIHLREADALALLRNCGEIVVPETVAEETTSQGEPLPKWVLVRSVGRDRKREAQMLMDSAGLHRGEAECIVLALDMRAAWMTTDDAAARYCASTAGLEVHGTLGVVLFNAAIGLISSHAARMTLETLRRGSLYMSDMVFDRALRMLAKIQ